MTARALVLLLGVLLLPLVAPASVEAGGCVCRRRPRGPSQAPPPPPPPATPPPPSSAVPPTAPLPRVPMPATGPATPTTPTSPGTPTFTPPTAPSAGPQVRARTPGAAAQRNPRTAFSSSTSDGWREWWVVNDRAYLRGRAGTAGVTTPVDTARGREATTQDGRAAGTGCRPARQEEALRSEILPALRAFVSSDASTEELLLRTALLALGKVGQGEEDAARIAHWVRQRRASEEVRQAAALGLGLLRRSEASRRLETQTLDALRDLLARVVEDASESDGLRATAALALGLLGDQPFGSGIHAHGRLVTHRLWRALAARSARADLPVALLTALGLQPPAGLPDRLRALLVDGIQGRTVQGRRWEDVERGHALTALSRLDPSRALALLSRSMPGRRTPTEIRRAGMIALGRIADDLSHAERTVAAHALRGGVRRARDPLTKSLAWIAVGKLVSAQVRSGTRPAGDLEDLWDLLLAEPRNGTATARGFALVGLGLAARPGTDEDVSGLALTNVRAHARRVLTDGLAKDRGDAELRSACAIALGLMESAEAIPELVRQVEGRDVPEDLRRDAAIALGQVGRGIPEVIRALHLALADGDRPRARSGAALGLALLRGPSAGTRLLAELDRAKTSTDVLRLTEPLGLLGEPSLARPLVAYARASDRPIYARAFLIVALGNLGDPEPRPSLTRVAADANYPSAPAALADVLTTR